MKNYLLKQTYRSALYPAIFLMAMWLVFFVQDSFRSRLLHLGVLPRQAKGLTGIFTSVFIHGDLGHIASNSLPILVLGMMLFYFYRKIALPAFFWIWFISGFWLWIGGRSSESYPMYHIGASTLIYGLAAFLFFSGVFRRHLQLMVVSALVLFLYGSIVWGVFPIKTDISWEGHLFGAIAGLLVAFNYRKEGPQRKVYEWESEEETPEVAGSEEGEAPATQLPNQDTVTITYIYKTNAGPDNKLS